MCYLMLRLDSLKPLWPSDPLFTARFPLLEGPWVMSKGIAQDWKVNFRPC